MPTKNKCKQHVELEDTAGRIAEYALEVAAVFECASELSDSYYNMDEYEQANFVETNADLIEAAANVVRTLLKGWVQEYTATLAK